MLNKKAWFYQVDLVEPLVIQGIRFNSYCFIVKTYTRRGSYRKAEKFCLKKHPQNFKRFFLIGQLKDEAKIILR